ncbi:MAG: GNAT family N-acetyltransferase [Candidatus Sumerlaeota bacterium]|nr:GNAT family N-acetyltransferase [Candidatus Sumerlaeota bacterium]
MPELEIALRPAEPEDARLLFNWRNDDLTRQVSFHSEKISWEEHIVWYNNSLSSTSRQIFIGEVLPDQSPCGQVRFDLLSPEEAEISIVIAPEWRGKGLGKKIISAGVEKFHVENPAVLTIIANIKPENAASKKVFQHCGFEYIETYMGKEDFLSEKWLLRIS